MPRADALSVLCSEPRGLELALPLVGSEAHEPRGPRGPRGDFMRKPPHPPPWLRCGLLSIIVTLAKGCFCRPCPTCSPFQVRSRPRPVITCRCTTSRAPLSPIAGGAGDPPVRARVGGRREAPIAAFDGPVAWEHHSSCWAKKGARGEAVEMPLAMALSRGSRPSQPRCDEEADDGDGAGSRRNLFVVVLLCLNRNDVCLQP